MRVLICMLGAVLLTACGQSAPIAETTPPTPETLALRQLSLENLAGADISGRLSGELGCSFTANSGEQLLTAMGFVASQERAEGIVKRDGTLVDVQATEEEGFDGLDDGATFNGEGFSAEVTPAAAIETGHEGSANTAALTVRADGQERAYEGTWSCGP